VAAGRVHAVRLVGDLPAGVSGSSLVELHWRDRSISRVGQVRQIVSDGPVPPGSSSGERVVVGDLVAALSSAHPGLAVTSGAGAFSTGLRGTVLGWQVPGWIVLAHALAWLVTLAFLINGPEPWRATRWAWFWIIANPLGAIGALAFLLLSGPTPLLPAARPGGRRLHGGWAFLLATVVSGPWRQ